MCCAVLVRILGLFNALRPSHVSILTMCMHIKLFLVVQVRVMVENSGVVDHLATTRCHL